MARVLSSHDFTDMPWKNGHGVTTEIFRMDVNGKMAFRISSASVKASGAFSDFSGYERSLVNIGGGTMFLTHSGHEESTSDSDDLNRKKQEEKLPRLGVAHFDGGQKTYCRVEDETRDLNIFCGHDLFFASTVVRQLVAPEFLPVPPSSGTFLFVIEGSLVVQNNERSEFFIQTGEAILQEPSTSESHDRWMLASASAQPCVFVTVIFRALDSSVPR